MYFTELEFLPGMVSRPALKPPSEPPASEDRREAARYIAAMSGDLALMARRHGLDTLGYLLDIARMEADSAAHLANPLADPPAKPSA